MSGWLGFLFCEIAFRLWDALPDSACGPSPECRFVWWARPINGLASAFYGLGCSFYGRAA